MSEPFIGQICPFGFNFPPRGWAICSGQILSIAQNTALFSLLGTTYGGNGQTTFALPDLRGRMPVGQGQGPGLSNYTMGQVAGTENVTLLVNNLPAHTHPIAASSAAGITKDPSGAWPAAGGAWTNLAPGQAMAPPGIAGGNQPFSLLSPCLTINWCIALEGIFPSRN